ncbi:MAG: hypothetical protein PUD35_06565, partial [Bacteroidales bacterium]|nr:hypothetical protein [Bacteroidales bacterium]
TTFDGLDDILKKNLGIIENNQKKCRQSIIIHTIFHKNRGISKKRLNFAKSYIDNTEKLK